MERAQVEDLLLEMLEMAQRGIKVYEAALGTVLNDELRSEWDEYLEQARVHESILRDVFATLHLSADRQAPGRQVARTIGEALVAAIALAKQAGPPAAAEIVAGECVVLAETKELLNWELVGELGRSMTGAEGQALRDAYHQVEQDEDEHLYQATEWTRELYMQRLGLPASLPPPPEDRFLLAAAGAKGPIEIL